jgi:hypothetical protein
MYTRESPFLYPEQCTSGRRAFGRQKMRFHALRALPEGCAVPLGFCCGGFSSTSGYDTGNEAQALQLERLCYFKADHLLEARRVFIRVAYSKPFGFSVRRQ